MATKKTTEPQADPKLVETISQLYSMYSGYEIADAHRIVRAEITKREALERAEWELTEAQKHLEELKSE